MASRLLRLPACRKPCSTAPPNLWRPMRFTDREKAISCRGKASPDRGHIQGRSPEGDGHAGCGKVKDWVKKVGQGTPPTRHQVCYSKSTFSHAAGPVSAMTTGPAQLPCLPFEGPAAVNAYIAWIYPS
jgi:hypothetical protein